MIFKVAILKYASVARDLWCNCRHFNYEIEKNSCQCLKPSLHLILMQMTFSWCRKGSPRSPRSGVPSRFPEAVCFFPQIEVRRLEEQQTPCESPCWLPAYLESFNFTLRCTEQWLDSAGSWVGRLLGWLWFFPSHFRAFGGNQRDRVSEAGGKPAFIAGRKKTCRPNWKAFN